MKRAKPKISPRPTGFAKNSRRTTSPSKIDRTARRDGNVEGKEYVYGLHTLRELLRAKTRPLGRLSVIRADGQFADIVHLARVSGVPVSIETREQLNRLVPDANHQGVVALVSAKAALHEDDLLAHAEGPAPLFLVLDSVQDPHNLGAVIRTAEAAGVDGVFIPQRRSVGLTAGVARASAGALEYVSVARMGNTNRLLEKLQEACVRTCALTPTAATSYTDIDLTGPIALVFGSEGEGIRPSVVKKCEVEATIPMAGTIGSLNLSVSVAVVVFEAMRQRREGERGSSKAT